MWINNLSLPIHSQSWRFLVDEHLANLLVDPCRNNIMWTWKQLFSKSHGVAMSELKFIYLAKFLLLSPTFFNLVHRKNTKRGMMRRYYHEVAGSLCVSLSLFLSFFLSLPNRNLLSAPDSTFISLTLTRKSLHERSTSFSPFFFWKQPPSLLRSRTAARVDSFSAKTLTQN